MSDVVEVVYGPNGEAYLALRKSIPLPVKRTVKEEDSNVIVIDMFEEDRVCYEC